MSTKTGSLVRPSRLLQVGVAIAALSASMLLLSCRQWPDYRIRNWGGEPVDLYGRVVGPDGAPVAGALIQIFTPSTPHDPPSPIGPEARSNTDGSFVIQGVQPGAISTVVVRGNGGHLTFDRHLAQIVTGRVSLGTFVVGPQRQVSFRIHCRAPLVEDSRTSLHVEVQVRQMPSNELIVVGYLVPSTPSASRALPPIDARPGRSESYYGLDTNDRELQGMFSLPVGTNLVRVSGSCGESTTTCEVPATGPVLFEQSLPN